MTLRSPARTLVATGNGHKVAEFQTLLVGRLGVLEPAPKGFSVVEDGATFAANAALKARALLGAAAKMGAWVLADDSGLSVDALGGAPGIFSARYADPAPDQDKANRHKLLRAMAHLKGDGRRAHFVCALALCLNDGRLLTAQGAVSGHIVSEPRGGHGFGYDSLFVPDGHAVTFGQGGDPLKSALSHRARAVEALMAQVQTRPENEAPCAS